MATLTKDDIWKVVQMGLAMMVMPLAGWVWNMNVEVAELRNEQINWGLNDIDVIGPFPAFPSRVRGHYRWQVILKGSNPRLLLDKIYLRTVKNAYGQIPKGWVVDVDPIFT